MAQLNNGYYGMSYYGFNGVIGGEYETEIEELIAPTNSLQIEIEANNFEVEYDIEEVSNYIDSEEERIFYFTGSRIRFYDANGVYIGITMEDTAQYKEYQISVGNDVRNQIKKFVYTATGIKCIIELIDTDGISHYEDIENINDFYDYEDGKFYIWLEESYAIKAYRIKLQLLTSDNTVSPEISSIKIISSPNNDGTDGVYKNRGTIKFTKDFPLLDVSSIVYGVDEPEGTRVNIYTSINSTAPNVRHRPGNRFILQDGQSSGHIITPPIQPNIDTEMYVNNSIQSILESVGINAYINRFDPLDMTIAQPITSVSRIIELLPQYNVPDTSIPLNEILRSSDSLKIKNVDSKILANSNGDNILLNGGYITLQILDALDNDTPISEPYYINDTGFFIHNFKELDTSIKLKIGLYRVDNTFASPAIDLIGIKSLNSYGETRRFALNERYAAYTNAIDHNEKKIVEFVDKVVGGQPKNLYLKELNFNLPYWFTWLDKNNVFNINVDKDFQLKYDVDMTFDYGEEIPVEADGPAIPVGGEPTILHVGKIIPDTEVPTVEIEGGLINIGFISVVIKNNMATSNYYGYGITDKQEEDKDIIYINGSFSPKLKVGSKYTYKLTPQALDGEENSNEAVTIGFIVDSEITDICNDVGTPIGVFINDINVGAGLLDLASEEMIYEGIINLNNKKNDFIATLKDGKIPVIHNDLDGSIDWASKYEIKIIPGTIRKDGVTSDIEINVGEPNIITGNVINPGYIMIRQPATLDDIIPSEHLSNDPIISIFDDDGTSLLDYTFEAPNIIRWITPPDTSTEYSVDFYEDLPTTINLRFSSDYYEEEKIPVLFSTLSNLVSGTCSQYRDYESDIINIDDFIPVEDSSIQKNTCKLSIIDDNSLVRTYIKKVADGSYKAVGTLDNINFRENWHPYITNGYYFIGKKAYYMYANKNAFNYKDINIGTLQNVEFSDYEFADGIIIQEETTNLISNPTFNQSNGIDFVYSTNFNEVI